MMVKFFHFFGYHMKCHPRDCKRASDLWHDIDVAFRIEEEAQLRKDRG